MFMKTIVHYIDETEEPQEENLRNTEGPKRAEDLCKNEETIKIVID